MPARIIGMIGVTPPKEESTLLVIEGEISPLCEPRAPSAAENAGTYARPATHRTPTHAVLVIPTHHDGAQRNPGRC